LNANFSTNVFSKRNENIKQEFRAFELTGQYPFLKNKSIRLAPVAGVGYLMGTTSIRRDVSNQTLSALLATRNTAEIFNHQGYVNVGLVAGFKYSPSVEEHIFDFTLGYRRGFAASDWSANELKETLSSSVTDKISQVYLQFTINMIRIRRSAGK
jgi:hypothetical protein